MKYVLKPDIRMADFILAVNHCEGPVTFETQEGDVLNLKSELCKYIFLAVSLEPKYLESCNISCSPQDAALLTDYIAVP